MKLFRKYKNNQKISCNILTSIGNITVNGNIENIDGSSRYPYLIKLNTPIELHGYKSSYVKIKKSSINYFKSLFL